MEKFYIQVDENNAYQGHPHRQDNLEALFPEHDFASGAPEGFVEFIRSEPPKLGPYQKFDNSVGADIALAFNHNGLEYRFEDGVYKDVWHVLEMTAEERAAKQEAFKAEWNANVGWASWTFDEETCSYNAPIPVPTDGNAYTWNEDNLAWEAVSNG